MTQIGELRGIRDSQTYAIIGAAMEVHRLLGSKFLEAVYQAALTVEFDRRNIPHAQEVELPVYYKDQLLSVGYRSDFVCFGGILVELKTLDRLTSREEAQVVNYLAVSRLRRGLLLNFGSPSLQFQRYAGPNASQMMTSVKSVESVGGS